MNGLRFGTLLCLGAIFLSAQELRDYGRKVTEFSLPNGLHFIVLERHQVPVVSFHTYVGVGSTQDPTGHSGLASLLARLAFSGTETVGTRNWPAEKKALEDVEAALDRTDEERNKPQASAAALATLQTAESTAMGTANQAQNPEEYIRAIQENGGVGMDSHATPDSIETSYSLPSNRLELWFVLESQRLAHPVFRDFYPLRAKLAAETNAVLDSRSPAKLRQSLLSTAFEAMPYRNPVLGWPNDVITIRAADAKAFWDTFCVPGNTVISIVGDVDPANARRLAERYFASIPARPRPPVMRSVEIPQAGPKTVAVWSAGEQLLMVGYKRPPEMDHDDPALDLLALVLGDHRTGWLHQELVETKQIAQSTEVISSLPSTRNPNLFVLSVTPSRDHTVEENRKAVDEMIARLQSKPVDAATLARVKNLLHGRFARTLGSNQAIAALLPVYFANYGDWRRLFTLGADYDRVTADDIQRVALQYLTPAGRTTAYMSRPPQPGTAISVPGGLQ